MHANSVLYDHSLYRSDMKQMLMITHKNSCTKLFNKSVDDTIFTYKNTTLTSMVDKLTDDYNNDSI